MPATAIKRHQTIVDFAVQHVGSIDGWLQVALSNVLSLTDDVQAGTQLEIGEIINNKVATFFIQSGNEIASKRNGQTAEIKEGIGFWIVSLNFKVS
jgi:hypothetical protein